MPDMLVNLSTVKEWKTAPKVEIRRAHVWEMDRVMELAASFYSTWPQEVRLAFYLYPIKCWVAISDGKIIGFAVWDCAHRNFFGPMGVEEPFRKNKTGTALLMACLHSMRQDGYGYAIIGGVNGPQEFYRKAVGAEEIKSECIRG